MDIAAIKKHPDKYHFSIARLNDEDRVVEEYVYGSRVNVPEYMIKDGRKYRFITDHRGSVRMVVDTHTGEVMQRTDYDEFGYIIDEDLAENWTPVLFGYAGGLQDRDTGLIRFGARDYDPMVGRWTSKEPLGFNGSDNFYVYADNDPINKIDITGLDWISALADFSAGFGDTMSFGLTEKIREWLDINSVDPCSTSYSLGNITGFGFSLAFAGNSIYQAYKVPKYLYHYTSIEGAAGIIESSVIRTSQGLYGKGVYLTKFHSRIVSLIQGAKSTEATIKVSTKGLNVSRTVFPGTFKTATQITSEAMIW